MLVAILKVYATCQSGIESCGEHCLVHCSCGKTGLFVFDTRINMRPLVNFINMNNNMRYCRNRKLADELVDIAVIRIW